MKQKENGPKNIPDKAISNCKTNMYTAVLWMRKVLILNLNLARLCTGIQENLHIFNSSNNIDMHRISNLRLLHDASYICDNINALDYPHLIKKNSDNWHDLLHQSYVTDTTICDALGLKGFNTMRKHFKQFVKEERCHKLNEKAYEEQMMMDGFYNYCKYFHASLSSYMCCNVRGRMFFPPWFQKKEHALHYFECLHKVNPYRMY